MAFSSNNTSLSNKTSLSSKTSSSNRTSSSNQNKNTDMLVPTTISTTQFTTIPSPTYRSIDEYTLIKRLGAGSYGEVWTAKRGNNEVVIKFSDGNPHGEGYNYSVLAELAFPLTLSHPHIVRYSTIIGPAPTSMIKVPINEKLGFKFKTFIAGVMPRSSGDLYSLIINKNSHKIIIKNYTDLTHQLVEALAYLTSHNIIHRDIKPQNILYDICTDNHYKLTVTDFGISTNRGCYGESLRTDVYTIWYRPPEIAISNECQSIYNASADIWAMGCVFYEMLTGHPLFPVSNSPNRLATIIFSQLGVPSSGSDFFKQYNEWRERLKNVGVSRKYPISNFPNPLDEIKDPVIRDLIVGMLVPNPEKRLTINQVQAHPLFKNTHVYESNNSYQYVKTPIVDCTMRDQLFCRDLKFNHIGDNNNTINKNGTIIDDKYIKRIISWAIDYTIGISSNIGKYGLTPPGITKFDMYFVAIQLFFRFLVKNNINKNQVQLCSDMFGTDVPNISARSEYSRTEVLEYPRLWMTAALSLSNVFMDILTLTPNQHSRMISGNFSGKKIIWAQRVMMKSLDFDILARTPFDRIQSYSGLIEDKIIHLAGNLLTHLSKLPYFFELRKDDYVYRNDLPVTCLVLAHIGIAQTIPTLFTSIDISSIEIIISSINGSIPTRGFSRNMIGLDLTRDEWNNVVKNYRRFKRTHPNIMRGIILTQRQAMN